MEDEVKQKEYLESLEGLLAITLLSTEGKYLNCQDRAVEILKLLKEKISARG